MSASRSPSVAHSHYDEHDEDGFEHDDHHDEDSQIDPDASHLGDLDESSIISTSSNLAKGPIDFSDLPSTIEIHPQNGHLQGSSSTQQFIKRPLNAYMIWTVEQRAKIKRAPRQKMNEISRQMGEVWKKMSEAAKAPYFKQAKKYAEEHKKALKENPNLAYIPSRKKARMSKPDKEDGLSNPSSPDPSIPASPAPSGRGQSFAPMSPTPTTPTHVIGRSPIAHVNPGSSFVLQSPPPPQGTPQVSGSKFSFVPPYPPIAQQGEQLPDTRYVAVPRTPLPAPTQQLLPPSQPTPNMVHPPPPPAAYEFTQMTQQPMPYRSLASQPNNQPCSADMQLTSSQIRERYYSALCAPLVPQLYELPSTLKDSNYYYDLHLQVFKRPL